MNKKLIALASALALGASAAHADLSYTYVEAGYMDFNDNGDFDTDATYLQGSFSLTDSLFIKASWTGEDGDWKEFGHKIDVDGDRWGIGLGAHTSLLPGLDLVFGAEYANADSDLKLRGPLANADESVDADIWSLDAGLRFKPITWLEVYGTYTYSFIDTDAELLGDDEDSTSDLEIGARFYPLPLFSIGVGYISNLEEGGEALRVAARLNF